jgi:excisionase family DNA binding protein
MTWRAVFRDLIDAAGADELPDVLGELERARALVLRRFLNGDGEPESEEVLADLTVAAVAEMFDRHPNTIRDWLHSGALAGYRLNNREWRIPRSSLAEFQQRQRLGDDPATPALGKARPRKLGDWRRHRSAS